MYEFSILQILAFTFSVLSVFFLADLVVGKLMGNKKIAEAAVPTFLAGCIVMLCAASGAAMFFASEDLSYPYSTYIQDGTTLVEGEKVVERLPDKYQEAIARLRFGQNAYSIREASVKNKLKGDGIQQDHTVVWLERPEDGGFMGLKRRFVFVGVSHDVLAKVERSLKIELSEDQLREMLDHFPGELRDPVLTTFASGGYKVYGLGPVTYSTFGSVSEVCAIQLIKEKQMPTDIANQRQRVIVDEVDVFVEDRTITGGSLNMRP